MASKIVINGEKKALGDNEDQKNISDKELPLSFTHDRHLETIEGINCITQTWRMKERMKTVSVALVLCLNVGVDPPDVVKTQPCARLECWIDPLSMSPPKALEKIGQSLQTQYERWQPRARYKQSLDPTSDEVKKLCTSLRRNAKEERVLFHYNGHGVPKPTTNGEIWVFNRTYTQYIPLSIYDLQTWMGAPSIYVYDCSNAGIIVESFKQFALQHESEYEQTTQTTPSTTTTTSRNVSPSTNNTNALSPPTFKNCIQLAACSANQVLPMNPNLPADLFTACLTTPIKVALRWFVLQSTAKLVPKVSMDLIDKIPGQITDRRTMLGELNWIFTAITDTIAWNTLPRDLFQKLFRQDLLVASLFRNFLLAERIMRSCDCTPISSPELPTTYQHPMWNAWDLALDLSLGQLPNIINNREQFQHLPFFEEQLTAFQVWLELGSEQRNPPEQLPIVLQVLLSQVHRMRALELLGKFLDLGPWAVNLALSVGIFPYVLKLLQSCAKELRPLLVFIWAKILAVDNGLPHFQTCQADLVRDSGHKYFLSILQDTSLSSEHRTMATFVLACIVSNFTDGQEAGLQGNLITHCLEQLNDPSPHLRQWVAICLGRLWDHYEKARWIGVRDTAHEKLYKLLKDPWPEVRASAVYALGTFINSVEERSEHANNIDHSVVMTLVNTVGNDMSVLVRKELVSALQWVILAFEQVFVNVALKDSAILSPIHDFNTIQTMQQSSPCTTTTSATTILSPGLKRIGSKDRLRMNDEQNERMKRVASSSSINSLGKYKNLSTLPSLGFGSVYMKIWIALCNLETDPHPEVGGICSKITGYIRSLIKEQRELAEMRTDATMSLPPSPNKSNYLAGYSPPTLFPCNDLQKLNARSKSSKTKNRKENSLTNETTRRKQLIETNFVAWCSRHFAQSSCKRKDFQQDIESRNFYERDWRHTRNNNIRAEAAEEQRNASLVKTDSQVFHIRTTIVPSLLQLHPFDQQIALAGKDSFSIWDWGTGAKTTVCHNKSTKLSSSRITAMEWINGHDIGMLMVASDDGSVKLWRPNTGSSRDPTLITAWEAFNTIKSTPINLLLTWEQWTQTLITVGDGRVIRFWDAERELRAFDIPIGTDSPVTCIDSTFSSIYHERHHRKYMTTRKDPTDGLQQTIQDDDGGDGMPLFNNGPKLGLCVVGCADGSIRLFDRRCNPNDARVKIWMEHTNSVLNCQLKDNLIISGGVDGDIKIYDIRKNDSVHTTNALQNCKMSCLAIHRTANYYACGSANFINIYALNGTFINTIRLYEGFMSHRLASVTSINYHPHRMALATGTSDCCISVYSAEGRR